MIWLTWRQHRAQAVAGAAALAAVGAVLVVTGLHALTMLRNSGIHGCLGIQSGDCNELVNTTQRSFTGLVILAVLLMIGPCLMGLFWGGPLVAREIEHGTHRVAWTQGVTRRRWIGAQLAFVVGLAVLAGAALDAMASWWIHPVNATGLRFSQGAFDVQGIVPIGYSLFAVALGTAAGAVMRKTLPAMGVTLAGFVALRAGILQFARPHYVAPLTRTYSAIIGSEQPSPLTGDWVLKSGYVDRAGHFSSGLSINLNGCKGSNLQCAQSYLAAHGIRGYDLYQPAGRFWLFQGIETAIFVGVAVALLAVTVVWVRRRLS